MTRSMALGIFIILLLSLIPVFLLFQFGPSSTASYSDVTQKLGQIAALVGVTLFALSFALSTRLKFIEDAFGGLDKVYIFHGIIGSIALVLLLFHPILLVLKFIPSNFKAAAIYLLPGTYWSVNFGIIALLGLAALIGITLYSKIKYQKWKFSHEFLGIIFIIAALHIFLVRTEAARDYIFNGYYIFAGIVSAIGIISFLYSLMIRDKMANHKEYAVKHITIHGDVFELTFNAVKNPLKYQSGQFVFLRIFNKHITSEPHPFSIASSSNNPELKVYIKKLGDYTENLQHVKIGDKVSIEGPYGKFNYTDSQLDQIWIAGGIGITPFIGMTQDLSKDMKNKVTLYYAVNSEKELVAQDIFSSIERSNENFKTIPWVKSDNGYLNAQVIKERSGSLKNKEFYICGPPGMKQILTKELLSLGVKKKRIIMEDFNLR